MQTESSHPLPFANLPPHHQHFVFIRHSSPYPICYNFFYQMYTLSNSACTFHYTYHPPALALLHSHCRISSLVLQQPPTHLVALLQCFTVSCCCTVKAHRRKSQAKKSTRIRNAAIIQHTTQVQQQPKKERKYEEA